MEIDLEHAAEQNQNSEPTYEVAKRVTLDLQNKRQLLDNKWYIYGKALWSAHRREVWKAMDYENWDRYVKQELHISDSHANALIQIHEFLIQYPKLGNYVRHVSLSNMKLIVAACKQDLHTRVYAADEQTAEDYLIAGQNMPWMALRDHLHATPDEEAEHYGPPPLSVKVNIPNGGEAHPYQVEVNPKSGEVLRTLDLAPERGRCIVKVDCIHCGGIEWIRVSRATEILETLGEEPEEEEE